ncbi:hypothetical protein F383_03457 [Gossypium arboreum]|uniref:Uncharacterized protein n=1 Tax=Gossypium arboreum TaxID=29729 RepID=A0A0B0NF54_GOSAR|nr:hypothetical protein F383_03137 [Gossypium arboreum]KHG18801.1 hypothetical protein F383_03457 [Gossypium arboreum]
MQKPPFQINASQKVDVWFTLSLRLHSPHDEVRDSSIHTKESTEHIQTFDSDVESSPQKLG